MLEKTKLFKLKTNAEVFLSGETLEQVFTVEVYCLVLVPIGVLTNLVNTLVARYILVIAVLVCMAVDLAFTVISTMIFLRPILFILRTPERDAEDHDVHIILQRTKWENLIGTFLTVGTSTLLYINLIIFAVLPRDTIEERPALNPFIVGGTS
jgi:hypothetical protein